ncbi:hypothetical protein A3H38_03200 [candidate division WOR-1 bacterium RIFCSPLOWO2_02_FULL_46_20]|uniref:Uncharacterized protein n=1 Tax=candidate division WOR-1 bacterium RIFCSPLOWO2_02_FULL_46_20 TaxID=1802567 RepID=A0A1F4RG81_UNCSA|nr:MAG: hypothetical protein A3H38_03200 [candidate division WOR-1 bacterium RIFCSPLOWO2_02_FULL_46_20]
MPIEVRAAVAVGLYAQFSFLFEQLGVIGTVDLVQQHTTLHDFHLPFPEEAPATIVAVGKDGGTEGLSDQDLRRGEQKWLRALQEVPCLGRRQEYRKVC